MISKELCDSLFFYSNGVLYRKKLSEIYPIETIGPDGYLRTWVSNKAYKVHRLIFLMTHGYLPKIIKHIDGNNLNNDIKNLIPSNGIKKINREINSGFLNEIFSYKNGELFWKKDIGGKKLLGIRAGYKNRNGYWVVKINQKYYPQHRLIWMIHNGVIQKNLLIDHINGDRSDNRIENLRLADFAQNSQNTKKPKNNSSGIKGISWNKNSKKWIAYVMRNKKYNYLGSFENIDFAKNVLERKRNELHGEFANHG